MDARLGLVVALVAFAAGSACGGDRAGAVAAIRQVGPDGRGSAEAAAAWERLSRCDVGELPVLLAGMDGANAVARNWLAAAVARVLERAAAEGKPVPARELETFLRDVRHDPQARRLAYELVRDSDPEAPGRLLPGMLDDPAQDLRREAVADLLARAGKVFGSSRKSDSLPLYRRALDAARDRDQIADAARRLRELGSPVDLPTHLGLVLEWKLVGPFPNQKAKGIETVYGPEKALDFSARYEGKAGPIRWVDYVSKDEYGVVDLNAGLAEFAAGGGGKPRAFEEAVAYAAAEFTAAGARDVELRLGCFTAFRLWVNGELVLARGDAYTGMKLDHYVARARLKPGKNTILVKAALDAPPPQLPKWWRFQLRVCDATGSAVLSATRPPPPARDRKPS